jgi:hypothetical protein
VRVAANVAVATFFTTAIAGPPQMRSLTICGAHPGEIGRYYSTRVVPAGAPAGFSNYALGVVYTDYRHVTRVESAGVVTPTFTGVDHGRECAEPEVRLMFKDAVKDWCAASAEFHALNVARCT